MIPITSKHIIQRSRVLHVGSLDRSHKASNSHEGSGLSVSLHPQLWRRIARLGDAPTYELSRRKARFINAYSAFQDTDLMDHIWAWAITHGYVLYGERFQVRYHDSEYEETRLLRCDSREEAEAEAEAVDGTVLVTSGYLPTTAMAQRAGHTRLPLVFVNDFALAFWAEDCYPQISGLWWNDELAPERLSAPRGVIFNDQIQDWQVRLYSRVQHPTRRVCTSQDAYQAYALRP